MERSLALCIVLFIQLWLFKLAFEQNLGSLFEFHYGGMLIKFCMLP